MSPSLRDAAVRRLDGQLVTALLLLYAGTARQTMDALGRTDALAISASTEGDIREFVRARTTLVKTGVNDHLGSGGDTAPADIRRYNQAALIPFLLSWAHHKAVIDVYTDTPSPDGGSMREATQWRWTHSTDFPGDCEDASSLGDASYADIMDVTGGPPPIHPRCRCILTPAS